MSVAFDMSGRQQTVEIIAYHSEVGVLCPDCVRRMRDQHLVLEEIGEYDEWWLKIGSAELVCSSCEDELAFITNWPEPVSPVVELWRRLNELSDRPQLVEEEDSPVVAGI